MSAIVEMDLTSPYEALVRDPFLCPDDSIKDDIRRFIVEQEANLFKLDCSFSQMSACDDDFKHIMKHKDNAHMFVEYHKAILSVKRQLPFEIWRRIFNLCLPHEWGVDFAATHAQEELGPWAIAAVCSHWRDIALNMTELWSTFKIGPARYDLARFDRRPIALSIERARGAPLSLRLDSGMSHFPHRAPGLIPWERVQNLTIVRSPIHAPRIKFDLQYILGQCTELRTVDICRHNKESDTQLMQFHFYDHIVQEMSMRPELLTFMLFKPIGATTVPRALRMTIRQLDSVLTSDDIRGLLWNRCRKLERLQVHSIATPHPDTQMHLKDLQSFLEQCSTFLSNLQQLDIHLPGVSFQGEILEFQQFRLPKLKTLRLFCGRLPAIVQRSELSRQLQSLSCRLLPELTRVVLCFGDIKTKTPQEMEPIPNDKESQVEVLQLKNGLEVILIFNGARDTTNS
ncbi:hypothetical protein CYLTODRAFT_455002 [Cylindrobasidium torrendii FP15055 ss-10]|uniref:F-box domain-containing protein n=1 Tax=Cylindrobasidium torrendii FP15055 ss-10 TaxID=1314674 RepID=A0A0D7BBH4_9AGAR|nr:hypothetical protein CYLTODRAFT_455002 [Cylindrobasidium torrendii FP15055 ss-10]